MKVTKDIDIKDLKEVFKRQIDFAVKGGYANVNINFVMALRILYVLEETQIREERHQTLESACTFMEMEDGTQTNEMELHNKTVIGMEDAKRIGKIACDAAVLNETQTNDKVPDCYGCYYDEGLHCIDCKSRESCVEETINRKNIEEDDDFI